MKQKMSNLQVIIGVVSVLVAIYLASLGKEIYKEYFTKDTPSLEQHIAESVSKQYKVPFMLDKETELTRVAVGNYNNCVEFQFRMVNFTFNQLIEMDFISLMEKDVKSSICKNKDYVKILKENIPLDFIYSDKNGTAYGIFRIEPSFCDK
jgi:hypothetical protein